MFEHLIITSITDVRRYVQESLDVYGGEFDIDAIADRLASMAGVVYGQSRLGDLEAIDEDEYWAMVAEHDLAATT
jgi:hypothetical protein